MSYGRSLKFDGSTALVASLGFGLFFFVMREPLRAFVSLTTTTIFGWAIFLGAEIFQLAYSNLIDPTIIKWGSLLMLVLLQALVGGYLLSDDGADRFIDPYRIPIIATIVGLIVLNHFNSDTNRQAFKLWLESGDDWFGEFGNDILLWFADITDTVGLWLAERFGFYVFLLIVILGVFAVMIGRLMDNYGDVAANEERRLGHFHQDLRWVRVFAIFILAGFAVLVFYNQELVIAGVASLPSKQTGMNVALIILALEMAFILPGLAMHFPNGTKGEEGSSEAIAGFGWVLPACWLGAIGVFSMGTVGFFPKSDAFAYASGLLTFNSAQLALKNSEKNAQQALQQGNKQAAAKHFGFAAAAAGQRGDLDKLEAMLNQLERAKQ